MGDLWRKDAICNWGYVVDWKASWITLGFMS